MQRKQNYIKIITYSSLKESRILNEAFMNKLDGLDLTMENGM